MEQHHNSALPGHGFLMSSLSMRSCLRNYGLATGELHGSAVRHP